MDVNLAVALWIEWKDRFQPGVGGSEAHPIGGRRVHSGGGHGRFGHSDKGLGHACAIPGT